MDVPLCEHERVGRGETAVWREGGRQREGEGGVCNKHQQLNLKSEGSLAWQSSDLTLRSHRLSSTIFLGRGIKM